MLKFAIILLCSSLTFCYCAEFTVTSQIYLDIKHGKEKLGQIVIGLFGKSAPKTVENFRQICLNGIDGKTYTGSTFHRVIRKFLLQGGDIISNDGFGSISIYGKYFDDENLTISHSMPGFVGMANRGPNTNGCQFYITTIATKWLDGKHTIFGKIVKGEELIYIMEDVQTYSNDVPVVPLVITSCGEIPTPKPYNINDDAAYSIWAWVKVSAFPLITSFSVLGIFHYFIRKLSMFC